MLLLDIFKYYNSYFNWLKDNVGGIKILCDQIQQYQSKLIQSVTIKQLNKKNKKNRNMNVMLVETRE